MTDNWWKVLEPLKAWALFFYSLTGDHIYDVKSDFKDTLQLRQESLLLYIQTHPDKISWKDIAEAVYQCGEESVLDELLLYTKSPTGVLNNANIVLQLSNIMALMFWIYIYI